MQTVPLGHTERKTSQLGYGCSSLMGAMGRRASIAVLNAAYEAGIRHFDVAPMYGFGEAESCLGEFLKGRSTDVTVTTKFGIEPPRHRGLLRLARRAAGPVLKAAPMIKKRLARAAGAITAPAGESPFTVEAARSSLERSLSELGVEQVDLLLLHEVRAEQLADERLLRFLEESVASGKIGGFGVGSERERVRALLNQHPAYCRTVQHEWSILDRADESRAGVSRIHHRALTDNFRAVTVALQAAPSLRRRWGGEVGADLADRQVLAALMIKAALELYPESVLLVSSKDDEHLRQNVRTAGDASLREPALRLASLAAREGLTAPLSAEAAC